MNSLKNIIPIYIKEISKNLIKLKKHIRFYPHKNIEDNMMAWLQINLKIIKTNKNMKVQVLDLIKIKNNINITLIHNIIIQIKLNGIKLDKVIINNHLLRCIVKSLWKLVLVEINKFIILIVKDHGRKLIKYHKV